MFADFWTYLAKTDLFSSPEIRLVAILLKQLDFQCWTVIDKESLAQNTSLSKTRITQIIKELIRYGVIESEKDSKKNDSRYRLNSSFGWKKTVDWVFSEKIDWQIFLNSLEKLQDKYQLEIKTIQDELGIITIHLEALTLADRIEVKKALEQEYYQSLARKYKLKQNSQQFATYQQNSINLLKVIKLITNPNNDFNKIKFYLGNKVNTKQAITVSSKQTLAEAVAEREKMLKKSVLALSNELTYQGNDTTSQKNKSFKQKIKARLDKHCY